MVQILAFAMEYSHACDCLVCGIPIVMSAEMVRDRRGSHATFYCVNGHGQHWPSKSDVEQLKDQLAERDRQLAFEKQRAATNYVARERAERKLKRAERRAAGGVCQCCNRSFVGLARHMRTKHPDFVQQTAPGGAIEDAGGSR